MATPVRVFVSYSHRDKGWLDELRVVLAPLIREERIAFWDDTKILPGTDWRREIEDQLHTASVAVLLVTAQFLASDFSMQEELPVILERAEANQLRLFWIAVEDSLVSQTPLARFQAVNDPKRPIARLNRPQRIEAWVKIAEKIKEALALSAVAGALGTIDESYNVVRSVIAGPAVPLEQHPIAHYSAREDTVAFTAQGQTITITAEDMETLDKDSVELIQMYEDSMRQRFDRIRKLYPSRILPNGDVDEEIERQLRNLARPMCEDLGRILKFLESMGKYLYDHYQKYHMLCSQIGS